MTVDYETIRAAVLDELEFCEAHSCDNAADRCAIAARVARRVHELVTLAGSERCVRPDEPVAPVAPAAVTPSIFGGGRSYATIMSGCVVRWPAADGRDFEVNASREGVSICASTFPVLNRIGIDELVGVLEEAVAVFEQLDASPHPYGDYPERRAVEEKYPWMPFGGDR